MSLNDTPSGERTHIGFFGLRNAGKSSLVNAVCNQDVAVVSDVAGTTTDVVRKSMEILPLGPVVVTDTPGIDDEGDLGEKRVARTRVALRLSGRFEVLRQAWMPCRSLGSTMGILTPPVRVAVSVFG